MFKYPGHQVTPLRLMTDTGDSDVTDQLQEQETDRADSCPLLWWMLNYYILVREELIMNQNQNLILNLDQNQD